jgi:magnesium transporter
MNGKNYLKILGLQQLFGTQRTKEILSVNPTVLPVREEAKEIRVFVYDYDADEVAQFESDKVQDCFDYKFSNKLSWINIDGLRKADVESVAQHFEIHPLLVEDILSVNQRPKMDEVEGRMLCVLNMLYFNETKRTVEAEQISIILGENFVISFQEDASRDVFNPLRLRLNMPKSQIRSRPQIISAML